MASLQSSRAQRKRNHEHHAMAGNAGNQQRNRQHIRRRATAMGEQPRRTNKATNPREPKHRHTRTTRRSHRGRPRLAARSKPRHTRHTRRLVSRRHRPLRPTRSTMARKLAQANSHAMLQRPKRSAQRSARNPQARRPARRISLHPRQHTHQPLRCTTSLNADEIGTTQPKARSCGLFRHSVDGLTRLPSLAPTCVDGLACSSLRHALPSASRLRRIPLARHSSQTPD